MAIESIAARAPLMPTLATIPHVFQNLRQRVDLGDVLIDRIDLEEAVTAIRAFLTMERTHQIVTVNLDFLSIAHRDRRFRDLINHADMAVADGMPLVWVSRIKGEPLPRRLTGVELVHECCRIAAEEERQVFLLGAGAGVAEAAGRTLEQHYPGLRVVGAYSPPFRELTEDEDTALISMINEKQPDFLFVALGAPRQDLWIHQHSASVLAPVAMGVGCVLDLYAGKVNRAPSWMQQAGLEWTYRLGQEPGRLWKRYLVDDIPMLARLTLGALVPARDSSDGQIPRSVERAAR